VRRAIKSATSRPHKKQKAASCAPGLDSVFREAAAATTGLSFFYCRILVGGDFSSFSPRAAQRSKSGAP